MTKFQSCALLFCMGFFLAISCVTSFFVGRKTAPKCPPRPADTVYVADTSHHEEPEPSEVIPAGFELIKVGTVAQLKKTIAALEAAAAAEAQEPQPGDTSQAAPSLPDTASVVVPLPFERRVYGGKEGDEYRAVVSGINPKLESIDVYGKTAYITQPVYVKTDHTETMYAFADMGADYLHRFVRTGLGYEGRITGPLSYKLEAGYEWSNLGKGGFMKGGLKLDLHRK